MKVLVNSMLNTVEGYCYMCGSQKINSCTKQCVDKG